jgi:NitT/TauT family transport system permease protein
MNDKRYNMKLNLWGWVGLCALVPVWWAASLLSGGIIIPDPPTVLLRFLVLVPTVMWRHGLASLARIVAGLFLALATAVPAGVAIGRSRALDRAISPLAYLLYPVPKIALLPVIMLLFGLTDLSKVAVVFLVLFFQLLIASRDAVKGIPDQYLVSLRSLGAGRLQIMRYVIWPALLPQLLSGLRVGAGTALAVLFFAETFGTRAGLGYFVMESWMRVAYPDMYAGILGLGVLGLAIFKSIDAVQNRACRWQRPVRG